MALRVKISPAAICSPIPTHPRQPSMNLGQAAAVCLYELAARALSTRRMQHLKTVRHPGSHANPPQQPAAPSANLDLLATVIEETMLAARYSPRSMQAANRHDLRLLLRRLAPTQRDARRILGLFRRILWRIKQSPK